MEQTENKEKTRDKKLLRAIIVSVILAAGLGVGIFFALNSQTATYYEFNKDYPAGTAITAEMLTEVQVDKRIVIGGQKSNLNSRYVTDTEIREVLESGDKLRQDVGQGFPLTESVLVERGGNQIEQSMTQSAIAVTVNVDNVTGVTNDLRAGSFVNVFMRVAGKSNVLQRMKVLSVNNNKNKGLISATLECNYEQAKILTQAADEGYIQFGLLGSAYSEVPEG